MMDVGVRLEHHKVLTQTKTATDSPALAERKEGYPERYNGLVPMRVMVTHIVPEELPYFLRQLDPDRSVRLGEEYDVYVNSYGAVSAILSSGKMFGLKPDEFEVMAWHPEQVTA